MSTPNRPGRSRRNIRDEPPYNDGIPSNSGRDSPISHRTRSRTSMFRRPDDQEQPARSRRSQRSQDPNSSRRDRSRSPIDCGSIQRPPANIPPREEEPPQCSICLDDLPEGEESTSLPCSHQFHPDCIKRWLEESTTCPLCRERILQPYQADINGLMEVTFDVEDVGEVTIALPAELYADADFDFILTAERRLRVSINGVLIYDEEL